MNAPSWYWNTSTAAWQTAAYDGTGGFATPPGTYTVRAVSTLNNMRDNYQNAGADFTGKTVSPLYTITLGGGPVNFTADMTTGGYPLTVQFTDLSSVKSPTRWNWSFGDTQTFSTTTAAQRNASHTYANPGTYTVNLTVTNATSSYSLVRPGYIFVRFIPAASFTANQTYGIVPMDVQFTDTSGGSPTAWNWSFGDGMYSDVQNPEHLYASTGNFTVSLNVTNTDGSNTLIRPSYINVDLVPSTVPIRVIPAGGTVYIGESGLNITQAMGTNTTLAWFASGAPESLNAPTKTLDVTGQEYAYAIDPADFAGYNGTWYSWSDGNTLGNASAAFNVVDPAIDFSIWDYTTGRDVTGRAVPVGDDLGFIINVNLANVSDERGMPAFGRITIRGPDGTIYPILIDKANTANPTYIPLLTSSIPSGPRWDTGNALYPPEHIRSM